MTITFAIATPPTRSATEPSPKSKFVNASSAACCASSASDGRVTSTTQTDLLVRRSNFISEFEGGGISTIVTSAELLDVIGGNLIDGRFIKDGLSDIPVTVLGNVTAQRLGINNLSTPTKILIENQWFGVVGILDELKIHPDLDRSVFIGYGVAKILFDIDEEPTTIYLRANPTFIEDVVEVLAPSMNPENPDQVEAVSYTHLTLPTKA